MLVVNRGANQCWGNDARAHIYSDLNLISDRGDAEVVQVRRRDPDGAGRAEARGGGAPQQTAGLQGEGRALQRQIG